jgi:predicted esterase
MTRIASDPHSGARIVTSGEDPALATGAIVLVHGRGATAEDILSLLDFVDASGFAAAAPQAHGHTWYPDSFLAPLRHNEPFLSSALRVLEGLVESFEEKGLPRDRIVVAGFSQGACLASEFVARQGSRFGGLAAFSGGLIGTKDIKTERPPNDKVFDYDRSLQGTPVFLGCSDVDPHIPVKRVDQTAEVLDRIGGNVTKRIYPGMPHTVNQEEMDALGQILRGIRASDR